MERVVELGKIIFPVGFIFPSPGCPVPGDQRGNNFNKSVRNKYCVIVSIVNCAPTGSGIF